MQQKLVSKKNNYTKLKVSTSVKSRACHRITKSLNQQEFQKWIGYIYMYLHCCPRATKPLRLLECGSRGTTLCEGCKNYVTEQISIHTPTFTCGAKSQLMSQQNKPPIQSNRTNKVATTRVGGHLPSDVESIAILDYQ